MVGRSCPFYVRLLVGVLAHDRAGAYRLFHPGLLAALARFINEMKVNCRAG